MKNLQDYPNGTIFAWDDGDWQGMAIKTGNDSRKSNSICIKNIYGCGGASYANRTEDCIVVSNNKLISILFLKRV